MKRILLLLAVIFSLSAVVKAQTVEVYKNGRLQVDCYMADSVNFSSIPMPSREEARDWAYAHLDSLVDVAWSEIQAGKEPNHRDPDATREVFRTIGYNGKNVFTYLLAGAVVDSVIMERLIDRAIAEGNHTAVLIAGNPGAGKSYSIRENPEVQKLVKEAGVVLDETFDNKEYFEACMARLKKAGIDDQTVVLVHNDALSSMKNSMNRYLSSGRVIGLKFFLYLYPCYVGYAKYLEDNNIGTHRFYLENANNTTGGSVPAAQAMAWDYSISATLKQQLTELYFDFMLEHHNDVSPRDMWAMLFDE